MKASVRYPAGSFPPPPPPPPAYRAQATETDKSARISMHSDQDIFPRNVILRSTESIFPTDDARSVSRSNSRSGSRSINAVRIIDKILMNEEISSHVIVPEPSPHISRRTILDDKLNTHIIVPEPPSPSAYVAKKIPIAPDCESKSYITIITSLNSINSERDISKRIVLFIQLLNFLEVDSNTRSILITYPDICNKIRNYCIYILRDKTLSVHIKIVVRRILKLCNILTPMSKTIYDKQFTKEMILSYLIALKSESDPVNIHYLSIHLFKFLQQSAIADEILEEDEYLCFDIFKICYTMFINEEIAASDKDICRGVLKKYAEIHNVGYVIAGADYSF